MDSPVFSQASRAAQISSPFGGDTLLVGELSGSERLSQLFHIELRLFSDKGDLDPDAILGKPVTVTLKPGGEAKSRYFHGLVTDFSLAGYNERLHEYRATVRPWLWFLTRTADCRIYQTKTVPEIFQDVCRQAGFSDYRLSLAGKYEPWDYCVQYRETDFAFLSRLLEQEGIFYFFEHSKDKHVLVLCDDVANLAPVAGYENVPFFPPTGNETRRERDHLSSWAFQKSFQPGMFATRDYDFKTPTPLLAASDNISRPYDKVSYEIYDYPAEAATQKDAERVAKVRIQELQIGQLVARGSGNAAGLATGALFKLTGHPRGDQNIQYLIAATDIKLSNDSFHSGAGGAITGPQFNVSLEALDAREPFRPGRTTPKPVIQGSQTAVVVGPKADEIHTDEFGRVKVQFHWDRYGKLDADSSCWIRVAQPWAGKGWGAIQIPRIGQEVVVSFLEGDPDRPIVVGSVYNGANKPPYSLPDNKTQSGLKTRSSMQGTGDNCNEIRFEDKKGSEQLLIHAEKNQDIEVENDESHSVGNDRKKEVKHDETVAIGNDRKEEVKHDETITIGNDRKQDVKHDENVTIGNDRTESVTANERIKIGKDQDVTIGARQTLDVGKDRNIDVGNNQRLNVGRTLTIDAGDAITITTGNASISMRKDGTIAIRGRNISIEGSGKINVKGVGDVVVKGSKVQTN